MTPRGNFSEIILIATGVGMSPFCSLIPTLLNGGYQTPISLYWGLRCRDDICLTESLDVLAKNHSSFSYCISLSQPPEDWHGLRGRVTETFPRFPATIRDKLFYLSGNGAMIAEMSNALAAFGITQSQIFEEYFFNLKYKPTWEDVQKICARFTAEDAAILFD